MLGTMALAMAPRVNDRQIRDRVRGWLRNHQHVHNLNQAQLARKMGTTDATVSRVFNVKRSVGLDVLKMMRDKLHMDLNVVFDGDAPPVLLPPPRVDPPTPAPSRAPATRSGSGR